MQYATEAAVACKQRDYQEQASCCQFDNQVPGDLGHCEPSKAVWAIEMLQPTQLVNVFSSAGEAMAWFQDEIQMDAGDCLGRRWSDLLVEEIREEVILLIRDGAAYVWDGWHRTAASIATGRPLRALVGRPIG